MKAKLKIENTRLVDSLNSAITNQNIQRTDIKLAKLNAILTKSELPSVQINK